MYELTYRSKARPAITTEEVMDIVNRSEENNQKIQISGCLVYHKGYFIQIIEGDKKNVINLFNKIKSDIRHSEIELMWEGVCDERVFANWRMAVCRPEINATVAELREFEKNLLMLSKFADKPTASVNLFWKNVSDLLAPDIGRSKIGEL